MGVYCHGLVDTGALKEWGRRDARGARFQRRDCPAALCSHRLLHFRSAILHVKSLWRKVSFSMTAYGEARSNRYKSGTSFFRNNGNCWFFFLVNCKLYSPQRLTSVAPKAKKRSLSPWLVIKWFIIIWSFIIHLQLDQFTGFPTYVIDQLSVKPSDSIMAHPWYSLYCCRSSVHPLQTTLCQLACNSQMAQHLCSSFIKWNIHLTLPLLFSEQDSESVNSLCKSVPAVWTQLSPFCVQPWRTWTRHGLHSQSCRTD